MLLELGGGCPIRRIGSPLLKEANGFPGELKYYEFMDTPLTSNSKCSLLVFNVFNHALHEHTSSLFLMPCSVSSCNDQNF